MSTTAGIDIGSEAIKAVVLSRSGKGAIELVAAGAQPIGELGHMDDGQDKSLALSVKLKELVRTARIGGNVRRIGASGKNSSIRYLQVPPVPPWRLDMLVKYEIEEKTGDKEPSTYDYRILDVPEAGGQYTVMIGSLKETAAADILTMGKASGLGEVEIDLEALALYNAYYYGHGHDPDKTVLVVDIGADDITILLCKYGALYFARTVMGGGRRFTQVLADELKIDVAEAEELKKTQAQISFDNIATPSPGRTGRIPRTGMTNILPRAGGSLSRMPAGAASAVQGAPKPAENAAVVPPALLNPEKLKNEETILTTGIPATKPAETAPAPAAPAPASTPASDEIILDLPPSIEELDAAVAAGSNPVAPAAASAIPPLMPVGSAASAATPIAPVAPVAPVAPIAPGASSIAPPTAIMNLTPGALDLPEEKRKRMMSAALVKEAASICAALENAVMFSRTQTKQRELKVDRVYVTGGGSKLKGLMEFMSRRMRMEVLPLEPFKQLSFNRLAPAQADGLKAEQHNMAVAVGLAVSNLEKGSLSYLLWPEALKQRKVFWARGAYLMYAAALVMLSFGLFLWTPFRNTGDLAANNEKAQKAVEFAQQQQRELLKLMEDNTEKRQQLKQIHGNTSSGQYFLNLLAELKNPSRITPDIYLTSISTNIPNVLKKAAGEQAKAEGTAGPPPRTELEKAAKEGTEPNTFQVQRRIYIRGFVRCGEKIQLISRLEAFKNKLVPHYNEPDHKDNLFRDIRTVWFSPDDHQQGQYCLMEFVLEAYTEGTGAVESKEQQPATKPVGKPVAGTPDPATQVKTPANTTNAAGAGDASKAPAPKTSSKPKFVLPTEQPK
jgi:Tfp pilus assembly PilM family ATPase